MRKTTLGLVVMGSLLAPCANAADAQEIIADLGDDDAEYVVGTARTDAVERFKVDRFFPDAHCWVFAPLRCGSQCIGLVRFVPSIRA